VQGTLEGLSDWLRSKRWGPVKKDISQVEKLLNRRREAILEAVPDGKRAAAVSYLDDIQAQFLPAIEDAVDNRDREAVWLTAVGIMLEDIGQIESLMVEEFPFEIPAEYQNPADAEGSRYRWNLSPTEAAMRAGHRRLTAPR
jgi:peptidylprolyl isomerase